MDIPSTSSTDLQHFDDSCDGGSFVDREQKLHDKIVFVRAVAKHRRILFDDVGGTYQTVLKEREDAWRTIAAEIQNLPSFKGRNWQRLRDHDWQYVRRHAMSRSESSCGTKKGGPIGLLDQLVLDTISGTMAERRRSERFPVVERASSAASNGPPGQSWRDQLMMTSSGSVDTSPSKLDSSQCIARVKNEFTMNMPSEAHPAVCQLGGGGDPSGSADHLGHLSTNEALFSMLGQLATGQGTSGGDVTSGESFALNRPSGLLDCAVPLEDCSTSNSPSDSANHHRKRRRSSGCSSSWDDRIKELTVRKLELEARNLELERQKLERELQVLDERERRENERHRIEMRRARLALARMEALVEDGEGPQ